jgi:cell wall-associated NlpC family hydrolase
VTGLLALVGASVAAAVTTAVSLPLFVVGAFGPGTAATPPSMLATSEIPDTLLSRYQASPTCTGLPWQVVAAVGWVESRHARSRFDPDSRTWQGVDPKSGATEERIVGPALDGSGGTRAIPATAASTANTGDPRWDHAVGPMQFLTSTFAAWGVDGSGDGTADPHNAFDAVASAGRFLCNGALHLDSVADALRRYNNSPKYVAEVLAKAVAYGAVQWEGSPAAEGGRPAVGTVDGVAVDRVVGFALAQLGEPYVWGGTGPDRWDCSGLTQAAYAAGGVPIGRTTAQQALVGQEVDWRAEPLRPADLVFTDSGDGRRLGHVGLALDSRNWVVAPHSGEVVRIAPIPFDAVKAVRRVARP